MARSYFAIVYPPPGLLLFGGAPYLVSSRFETRRMAQAWADGYLKHPRVTRLEIRSSTRPPQILSSVPTDRKLRAAGKDD